MIGAAVGSQATRAHAASAERLASRAYACGQNPRAVRRKHSTAVELSNWDLGIEKFLHYGAKNVLVYNPNA